MRYAYKPNLETCCAYMSYRKTCYAHGLTNEI